MRLLITTLLIAIAVSGHSQEAKPPSNPTTNTDDPAKAKSIPHEIDGDPPDFSSLPVEERQEALRKWYQENLVRGIPKGYIHFMEQLRREAKRPAKGSKYVGRWGDTPDGAPQLVLIEDGTFTFDYGHSKGVGRWLEHPGGSIWIGFAGSIKDDEGKDRTVYTEHFCYLIGDDKLVQDHICYTHSYKRIPSTDAKEKPGRGKVDSSRREEEM